MLSIICAYRNRTKRLENFIKNCKEFYPNSEIIIVEQKNSYYFLKGQLYNIGFNNSSGALLAFIDVDMYFDKAFNLQEYTQKGTIGCYPYTTIHQVIDGSVLKPLSIWKNSPGGFYVIPRQMYIDVNGHSNLYIGFGWEDRDIQQRANLTKRYDNMLYHIKHPMGHSNKELKRNEKIFTTAHLRDIQLDGLKQTTCECLVECSDQVKKINVSVINVVSDFIYKNLLVI